ncbi:MAG TPA: DUF11 domain-containing protein [Solirubrobacteraceae bacterium]|nr:DUF11 domain-containing protein [Solirubrobacteraceae bacterium]
MAALATALGAPALASAQTYQVASTADMAASNPADGCGTGMDGSGPCTLRSSIAAADAAGGTSTINLVAGSTYDLTIEVSDDPCNADSGELWVGPLCEDSNPGDVTIQVPGGTATIDGGGASGLDLRDLELGPDETLTIDDVTITGGDANCSDGCDAGDDGYYDDGGGIYNFGGTLMLNDDLVTNNASSDDGGGIAQDTALVQSEAQPRAAEPTSSTTIVGSTISGNTAAYAGGGIENESDGPMTLLQDTISGNGTASEGGGFDDRGRADNTLTNDTIVDNTITQDSEPDFIQGGAGVEFAGGEGTDTVAFDTFAGNTVVDPDPQEADDQTVNIGVDNEVDTALTNDQVGAGLAAHQQEEESTVELQNSILIGGASDGPDYNCDPDSITDLGGNLFNDSGSECGAGAGISDLISSDPLLGPLVVTVGPTATEVPANASPAVDAIMPANCTDTTGAAVTADQRGVIRPQGANCDIGAVEVQQADMAVTSSANPGSVAVGGQSTITDTVSDNGPSPGTNVVLSDPAAGYTIVSASASQGTCTHTATTVACALGTIPVGAHVVVTIVVSGTSAGTVGATATVRADQKDPNPANNTAQTSLAITAPVIKVNNAVCASLRHFTIHVQNARKLGLVSAVVTIGGRRYKLHKGHFSARVNLAGLPYLTFVVKITAHTKRGKVLHAKRTYHTCRLTPLPGHKFLLL